MARGKKNNTAFSVDAKISEAEKALDALLNERARIENLIKEKKQEISELCEKRDEEQLKEIATIAGNVGVSVSTLLAAFKDGTVLELISTSSQTAPTKAEETTPASAPTSTSNLT